MALVIGKPFYTDDLAAANALIVKILRSPHVFARIKSIDTARAEKLAGLSVLGTGKLQLVGHATFGGEISPPPYIAGFAEVEVEVDHMGMLD